MPKQYEARLDSKNRVTLRNADSARFLVEHRPDGSIILKPVELVARKAALPVAERKARLRALVAKGKVSGKAAKLIDFREPTPAVLARAASLKRRAQKALARNGRVAA